jgi:exopolysaccharide production protein ExoQ
MQSTATAPQQRVSNLPVTWVVLAPLFFFSSHGVLWFQSAEGNTQINQGWGSLGGGQASVKIITIAGPLIFAIAFLTLTRLRGILRAFWTNKIFIAMPLFALMSVAWSQFPMKTVEGTVYLLANLIFILYLYRRFTPAQQMQLMILLGGILVVASIVMALLFPEYGIDHRGLEGSIGAWQGTFTHKNQCGVTIVYLLSAVFFSPVKNMLSKIIRYLYLALSAFLLIMTQSRTAWILLAAVLGFVVIGKLAGKIAIKEKAIVTLFAAGAILLVGAFVFQYYRQITLFLGKDPTLTGRTVEWKLVFHSVMKRPIAGYGYSAFWHGLQGEGAEVSMAFGSILPNVDNGYLTVWLELGAIGLGLFVLTVIKALRDAGTCLRAGASNTAQWFLVVVLLCLMSNTVERMIMMPNYLLWDLYLLACLGLSDEAKSLRMRSTA